MKASGCLPRAQAVLGTLTRPLADEPLGLEGCPCETPGTGRSGPSNDESDPPTASPRSGRNMHTTNPSNFSSGLGAPKLAKLRSHRGTRRYERGFTLIELLVVMVIVAIIASIALPSYQESVRSSRRADAVHALQQIQMAQERLRAECSSYGAGLATARVCDPGTPANNRLAFRNSLPNGTGTSDDGLYTLALLNVTPAGYTATATAVAGTSQAADVGCGVLTLAVAGLTLTKTPPQCWTR